MKAKRGGRSIPGKAVALGGLSVSLALLTACGGSESSPLPSSQGQQLPLGARKSAAARFVIKVPRRRHGRGNPAPRYIGAGTKSLRVTIVPGAGGAAVVNETFDLTPASQGCSPVSGGTLCTFYRGAHTGQLSDNRRDLRRPVRNG